MDLDDAPGDGLVAVADREVLELELVGGRLVGGDVDAGASRTWPWPGTVAARRIGRTMAPVGDQGRARLTLYQRMAVRKLRRQAGRKEGEPLQPEDWEVAWRLQRGGLRARRGRLLPSLASSPRCGICGAPFAGVWARHIAGPLGYRPSRKNPTV